MIPGAVLVTGATGFVGTHTVAALVRAGRAVRAFVRDPAKLERVLEPHGMTPADLAGVEVGDVRDPEAVRAAVSGAGAVVHTAAVVATDPSRDAEVEATNLVGSRHVLDSAVESGCRVVVHVSSAAALFPFAGGLVRPDDPVGRSSGAYARSKAACEVHARRLQAAGHPVVSVYPSGIIGPDDPSLTEMTRAAVFWLTRPFPRTRGASGAYVDVRDVAAVLVAVVDRVRRPARYLVWGHHLAFADQLAVLRRVTGRPLRGVPVPRVVLWAWGRAGDLARRRGRNPVLTSEGYDYLVGFRPGDQSATERDLGVRFRPVEETFADTFRWMHRRGLVDADAIGVLAERS